MGNYIHRDKKWFYRRCIELLNSDDRTIRNLTRVLTGQAKLYQHNYNLINKAELNRKQNQRYANLPIEEKLRRQEANRERYKIMYQKFDSKKRKEKYEILYPKLRLAALEYYGNGKLECICCGETNTRFLTLDHINNNGKQHRKQIGNGNLLAWIKRNNFPKGFQTLCFNCNSGRALNKGICPHKENVKTNKSPNAIHIEWHGVA